MKWLNFLKRTRIFQNIDRPILDKAENESAEYK